MIFPCLLPSLNDCCRMRMHSPVSDPNRRCAASSVTRRRVSSPLNDAQKNGLRRLWSGSGGLVRPQASPCARSVLRRHPGVSRIRGAARCLPTLRGREAGLPAGRQEKLDFLADNPLYTKRFAYYVGRRCRSGTIKDVAKELALDWHTVKALEKQYMAAQLAKAGLPRP